MTAFRTSISDFQLANPLYIGATIFFREVDESGAATDTLAPLFASAVGSQTISNPQTLDAEGKFSSPVYIDRPVVAQIVGANVPSHDTGVIQSTMNGAWRGTWSSETLYQQNDFVVEGDGLNVYVAAQTFTSGDTIGEDISAGNLVILLDIESITLDLEETAEHAAELASRYRGAEEEPLEPGDFVGQLVFNETIMRLSIWDGDQWQIVDEAPAPVPVGAIQHFATETPPPGYLVADGSAISRTAFADLFAKIGTKYGSGDGSTTFNLPDYRGEFLRGWDDGRGVDPGRVFGSSQLDQMQRIIGSVDEDRMYRADHSDFDVEGAFSFEPGGYGGASGAGNDSKKLVFDSANSPNARTSDTTDGETRPRNVAVLICIKAFDAVTDPALLDAQELINHIDNTLDVFAQRADAAKITTRQTVLDGPVDPEGNADFLEPDTGLQVTTKDLDVTPLVVTWGDGFDGLGEKNFIAQIDSNIAWDNLPDDTDDISLFLRLSGGTVTTFHEVLAPVYNGARPSSPSEGQTWYPTNHRGRMEIYENGAWNDDDLIICVGQCSTDGGSVVDVRSYAYQGKSQSELIESTSSNPFVFRHDIGTGTQMGFKAEMTPKEAEAGWQPGDFITVETAQDGTSSRRSSTGHDGVTVRVSPNSSSLYALSPKDGGSGAILSTSDVRVRFTCWRNF